MRNIIAAIVIALALPAGAQTFRHQERTTTIHSERGARQHDRTHFESRMKVGRDPIEGRARFENRETRNFEWRGRHDRDFYRSRYGGHFRFFPAFNEYFIFENGCWYAVDVEGNVYLDRTICPGDQYFIDID
jgi:hypothetical protein